MFHGGDGHQYAEDEWDRSHEADQNHMAGDHHHWHLRKHRRCQWRRNEAGQAATLLTKEAVVEQLYRTIIQEVGTHNG
jgi:hypothetical protein